MKSLDSKIKAIVFHSNSGNTYVMVDDVSAFSVDANSINPVMNIYMLNGKTITVQFAQNREVFILRVRNAILGKKVDINENRDTEWEYEPIGEEYGKDLYLLHIHNNIIVAKAIQ